MFSKLRSCIEDKNSRHVEEVKEAKTRIAAAKEKVTANKVLCSLYRDCPCCYLVFIILYACYLQEKGLRQKLQNETVKAVLSNATPLKMEKHDALLKKMKSEVAQAHAVVLKLKGTIPKGMLRIMMFMNYALCMLSCLKFFNLIL